MRIRKTLGEDLQGFVRLCGRIWKNFVRIWGRGFAGNRKTLVEDLQGFTRLCEMICETLGENLQGFARLWGRGFARIHETL